MKVTNWGDDNGLNINALHIEMGACDSCLTVELQSGHTLRIIGHSLYIADSDTPRTKDGKLIWDANKW